LASYSTNANVQNLVYGTTNTDLDAATTAARDAATSVINAYLNRISDITTPSDMVTRCATLLAAGFMSSGPNDKETNSYYKEGKLILESLKGDQDTDAEWATSYFMSAD